MAQLAQMWGDRAGQLKENAQALLTAGAHVRWIGPDADRHSAERTRVLGDELTATADRIRALAEEIQQHRAEQDEASTAESGTAGSGPAMAGMPEAGADLFRRLFGPGEHPDPIPEGLRRLLEDAPELIERVKRWVENIPDLHWPRPWDDPRGVPGLPSPDGYEQVKRWLEDSPFADHPMADRDWGPWIMNRLRNGGASSYIVAQSGDPFYRAVEGFIDDLMHPDPTGTSPLPVDPIDLRHGPLEAGQEIRSEALNLLPGGALVEPTLGLHRAMGDLMDSAVDHAPWSAPFLAPTRIGHAVTGIAMGEESGAVQVLDSADRLIANSLQTTGDVAEALAHGDLGGAARSIEHGMYRHADAAVDLLTANSIGAAVSANEKVFDAIADAAEPFSPDAVEQIRAFSEPVTSGWEQFEGDWDHATSGQTWYDRRREAVPLPWDLKE